MDSTLFNAEVGQGAKQPGGLLKDQLYLQHAAGEDAELEGLWAADKDDAIKCILPLKVVRPGDETDYAMAAEDKYVAGDTTSGVQAITLPPVAKINPGHIVVVHDEGGNANTNNITLNTPGDEQIEGSDTLAITADDAVTTLMWDGSGWQNIS